MINSVITGQNREKLSKLLIDVDKDWNDKAITNANQLLAGISTSTQRLHVRRTNGASGNYVRIEDDGDTEANRLLLQLKNNGITRMGMQDSSADGSQWEYYVSADDFFITMLGTGGGEFQLLGNNNRFDEVGMKIGGSKFYMMKGAASHIGIGTATDAIVQNADITLESGVLQIKETTTPTANAGYGKIYTKSDNKLYFQDGAGSEHVLPPALHLSVLTVTADYAPAAGDYAILADASDAAFTITLPAATDTGQQLFIKKIDSSANAVTIATLSRNTIEGAASVSLASQYDSYTFIADGLSTWYIISST